MSKYHIEMIWNDRHACYDCFAVMSDQYPLAVRSFDTQLQAEAYIQGRLDAEAEIRTRPLEKSS